MTPTMPYYRAAPRHGAEPLHRAPILGPVRTDHLLDQAGDLLHRGRAGKAATLLTPVVGEEPGNVGAWQLLARAHLDLGEAAAALDAARAALRLDPAGLESLYLVSAAYSAAGRHELAIAAA